MSSIICKPEYHDALWPRLIGLHSYPAKTRGIKDSTEIISLSPSEQNKKYTRGRLEDYTDTSVEPRTADGPDRATRTRTQDGRD